MSQYDGTLKFDTSLDDEGIQKGLDSLHDKAANALGVLAGNLMTQATNALINLGQTALNAGTSLEAGMAKVSTLFTGTDEELGTLTDEVRKLSSASGLAAEGLAEAAYSALSASVPAEQLGAMLDKSTKLAAAGFTDVDTALSATAKTMNAYGQTGEEAMDKIQKVLIQTQNKGITTVGELGASLSQVTPTAASFGVAFEQVGAALAVMTAQGVPTAQATTMLNGIIAELGKSGTEAAKNLAAAAEGSQYAGKSFTEMMAAGATLDEVLGLMSKYAEANGLAMVDMFSRIEAGKGALSIMANEGQTFRDDLAAMSIEADVVGEAYSKVADTVKFKSEQIKSSFQNIASGLYDLVSEPLKNVQDTALGALGRIQEGLTNGGLAGVGNVLYNMFHEAMAKIASIDWSVIPRTAINVMAKFITGGGARQILVSVMSAFTSIVRGLSDALPQLMVVASRAVGYIRLVLWEQLPTLLSLGLKLFTSLAQGAAAALPLIVQRAGRIALLIVQTLINAAPSILEAAKIAFGALVSAIPLVIEELRTSLPAIAGAIWTALQAAAPQVKEAALSLMRKVPVAIKEAIPEIRATLSELFEKAKAAIQAAAPQIEEASRGVFDKAVTAIKEAGVKIEAAAGQLFEKLKSIKPEDIKKTLDEVAASIPEPITSIANALRSKADELFTAAQELFGKIADAAPEAIYRAREAITKWVDDIAADLEAKTPEILGAAERFFGSIQDALPDVMDRLLYEVTSKFEFIISNIDRLAPVLLDIATGLFGILLDTALEALQDLAAQLPMRLEFILTELDGFIPTLSEAAVKLFSQITEALPVVFETLTAMLPELLTRLAEFLLGQLPVILNAGIQLFSALLDALPAVIESLTGMLPQLIDLIVSVLVSAIPILLDAAVGLFNVLVEAIPEILPALTAALPGLIHSLVDALIALAPVLKDGALELLSAILEAIPVIIDLLLEEAPKIIQAFATEVLGGFDRLLEELLNHATPLIVAIEALVAGIAAYLAYTTAVKAFTAAVTALKAGFTSLSLAQKLVTAAQTVMNTVMSANPIGLLIAAIVGLVAAFTLLWNKSEKFREFWIGLWESAKSAVSGFLGFFDDLPGKLLDIGKNLIAGLWNGIKESWGSLVDGFGDLIGGLVDTVTGLLGINSPSTVFDKEVGEWIPPGISRGVDRAMPAALDDMDKQADELVARMRGAIEDDLGNTDIKLTAGSLNATGQFYAAQTAATAPKWEQVNNYYVPVATPSETARTQREALRNYMGGVH